MRAGRRSAVLLVASVIAPMVVSVVVAGPASAARPFRVTSPAFAERGTVPDGFTCAGANASLPLRWTKPPKGTEQLALVMDDPDAVVGTFVHWVAWGIDPATRRLPEQVVPAGVVEGANGAGRPGYLGPCPPPADGPHHYRITLYALDAPPDVAAGTATAADLRAAMRGHILAEDRTVGTYDR